MSYHHVVARVGSEASFRCLFSDLSVAALRNLFVVPYKKGNSFFSGNDLISPDDLRSIQIVRTRRKERTERHEINRQDQTNIDEFNRSSDGVFVLSAGGGYAPEDIARAGKDVTHTFLKGPPGYKSGQWTPSIKVLAWIGSILSAVIATGVVKWLGWV